MQNSEATYRERLSPSLWVLATAALAGPMTALVFAPIDTTVALVVGGVVGILVVLGLIVTSSVIEVTGTELRAGRARIDARFLGQPQPSRGTDARNARGPGLSPRAWVLIRGGIDGLVSVPITDKNDPVREWVISSRTPDRLAAAIESARYEAQSTSYAAQSTQMGPSEDSSAT